MTLVERVVVVTRGPHATQPCKFCGGNAYISQGEDAHEICWSLAKIGAPTPSLGQWCPCCDDSGVHGLRGRPVGCVTCAGRGFVNCNPRDDPFTAPRLIWFADCKPFEQVQYGYLRFRSHVAAASQDDAWYEDYWNGDPLRIPALAAALRSGRYTRFLRTRGDMIVGEFSSGRIAIVGYYAGGQPDLPLWEGSELIR